VGDYVTCRQAHPDSALFSGTGYAVLQKTPPAVGTQYNPRYILFGRRPHGGEPGPIGWPNPGGRRETGRRATS